MRKLLTAVIASVATLALGSVALGEVVHTFKVGVKPARAGQPVALRVDQTAHETAAPQPAPLVREVLTFERGARFDGKRFKRCKLARLQAKGPAGCSKKSRIGTGTGTGSAKPIIDNVNAKLTLFNGERRAGRDSIYIFVLPDIGPTFVVVGTLRKKSGRYMLDFRVPAIKTLPLAPDAAVTSVRTRTPVKRITRKRGNRKQRHYLITAPKKCRKEWSVKATFHYASGEVKTRKDSIRCKRAQKERRQR
jgi:hypothetical protein